MSYEQLEDAADRQIAKLEAENERLQESSVENFRAVFDPGLEENERLRKRIGELEAKAETLQDNAELGRLVRQMPDALATAYSGFVMLTCSKPENTWYVYSDMLEDSRRSWKHNRSALYETAKAALEAGMKAREGEG